MQTLALLLALSAPSFAEYVTTDVNGQPVTVWVKRCGNTVWTNPIGNTYYTKPGGRRAYCTSLAGTPGAT